MGEINARAVVEALLFASAEPLSVRDMRQAAPDLGDEAIEGALVALKNDYEATGRAITLEPIAGGWQILTRGEFDPFLKALRKGAADRGLSQAALETLAVIAYKQPVGRADIEAVRGVNAGPILRGLLERGLIRITGRSEVLGHPLLYGTTDTFLSAFGLNSLEELPKVEDVGK
ncbi:MAG: SMC-Scp complex subunit ScpB [Planctomycetota bacterium]